MGTDVTCDIECLFCRIVRGDLRSFPVHEDGEHLAFLTLFPATPGVTVVIPRIHVGDDVFHIGETSYDSLLHFARDTAHRLERGLGVARVAMVFEGTGVPHVHAKLYPLHGPKASQTDVWSPISQFFAEYPGWLSTHEGPRAADSELARLQAAIRKASCRA